MEGKFVFQLCHLLLSKICLLPVIFSAIHCFHRDELLHFACPSRHKSSSVHSLSYSSTSHLFASALFFHHFHLDLSRQALAPIRSSELDSPCPVSSLESDVLFTGCYRGYSCQVARRKKTVVHPATFDGSLNCAVQV